MSKAKTGSGAGGGDGPDDLNNVRNVDLQLKLTKSSSKSVAWSYFGSLYFKEGDKIVESRKYKWICNVCFKEATEWRLFIE